MSNLSPIQIGSPNRLETTFNLKSGTSIYDTIFDDKTANTRIIANTGHGPILSYSKTSSSETITSKFQKENRAIYKKISPAANDGPGLLNFGPSEPYVTVNPNSSTKNIKKYDTRLLPIGSVIQDTVRISKFTVSGQGILFNAKQFLLQGQNAFNETRIYNPLSVLQSTIRPTSLGLIPRPKRHITLGSGLLDTFLGTLGIKDNNGTPPKGTSADGDKLDTLPDLNSSQAKGLIRAPTGSPARQNVLLKYGGTTSSEKGSFLGNLVKKLLPMFASNPNQFEGIQNDKIYRADQDLYALFIDYYKKQSETKTSIYNGYVQKYTGNNTGSPEQKLPGNIPTLGLPYSNTIYSAWVDSNGDNDGTLIIRDFKLLENGEYESRYQSFLKSPNNLKSGYTITPHGGKPVVVKTKEEFSSEIKQTYPVGTFKYTGDSKRQSQIQYNNVNPFAMKYSELSGVKRFEDHIRDVEYYNAITGVDSYEGGKGFARTKYPDKINIEDIYSYEPYNNDQIAFWFRDVVNNKYLQFRATVTGINDNSSIDWTETNYVGMPNKIYNYKGYTSTIGFNFVVYLNSVRELHPTWKKLNYLKSLRAPSKYVDGKYMVPPIVELRIGDIYHNVPIVLNSITFSIPDDVSWETLPKSTGENGDEYSYLGGMIKIPDVKFGQFPNRVEVNIGAYMIEPENFPRVGNTAFGPDQSYGGNFHLRTFEGKDNIVNGTLVQ